MTSFKRALLGATALTAIAGIAAAQSNESYTSQNGADNELRVEQSQSDATAGSNIAGNGLTGDSAETVVQDGDDNDIDIIQVHNGANGAANVVGTKGNGVRQTRNNNKLSIGQTGGDQSVFDVQQKGGAAVNANNTTITQTGSRQTVSNVKQTFKGGASDVGNSVAINQSGKLNLVGNTSSGPRADGSGITQTGNGHAADVDQDGRGNHLYTLDQSGRGGGGLANSFNLKQVNNSGGSGNGVREAVQIQRGGAANTVDILQDGTGNGGGSFVGAAGGVAGVTSGRLRQDGSGNDIDYDALGDTNRFGFVQDGRNNAITALSNGSSNELAILQDGNDNAATANQQGIDNEIGVSVAGNANMLNMSQDNGGIGAGNAISVTIDGDDNNNYNISPALSGDALDARNVARASGSMFSGLVQGDLFQNGEGNSMTLDVTGDSNAFAMAQNGDNNTISGTFTHGSGNQAVVAQVSSGNVASFSIGGVGNSTSVIQGN